MRFLIQRVSEASVSVDGQVIGEISKGLLVFIGICDTDLPHPPAGVHNAVSLQPFADIHSTDSLYAKDSGDSENIAASMSAEGSEKTFPTKTADKMIRKLIGLRIFEDENGKTNLDLKSVGGQLLIISQFTLYADCRKGNRPSFTRAGEPEMANALYRYMIEKCKQEIEVVEEGRFGADMKVALVNDGPFTVILDSDDICR